MSMQGDGREGQPGEGDVSVEDLAVLLDGNDGAEPGEAGEGEPDEPEGEEVEREEAEEGGEDEQEEPTVRLKHDGKEFDLKQSEVVELAQKGYDYTQKTMALSEDRKKVEAAQQEVAERRQQLDHAMTEQVNHLNALEQFLGAQLGHPPSADLIQSHGVEYFIAQKEQYEHRKGQLENARAAHQQLVQEQARQRQAWIMQQAGATERALRDTLPGWNENTLGELAEFAGKYGIGQKVADAVLLQKGFWELAHKAKAYDELLAKKASMKPVKDMPKVAAPKAQNQPSQLAKANAAWKDYSAKKAKGRATVDDLASLL